MTQHHNYIDTEFAKSVKLGKVDLSARSKENDPKNIQLIGSIKINQRDFN